MSKEPMHTHARNRPRFLGCVHFIRLAQQCYVSGLQKQTIPSKHMDISPNFMCALKNMTLPDFQQALLMLLEEVSGCKENQGAPGWNFQWKRNNAKQSDTPTKINA